MEDSLFTPQGLRINFFIWASRRVGGDASKRRKIASTGQFGETLAPTAALSGFPLQCFCRIQHAFQQIG